MCHPLSLGNRTYKTIREGTQPSDLDHWTFDLSILPCVIVYDHSDSYEAISVCYNTMKPVVDFCFCSCFVAFPSYISGVHHFWVRFLRMWSFFFFVDGACWVCFCCQRSPIKDMKVRIFWWNAWLDLGLYSHPKEFFGEWSLNPREKSPLPEDVLRGGSNPRRCGQRAQALPIELFRPPSCRR